jgi:hypothetical protein
MCRALVRVHLHQQSGWRLWWQALRLLPERYAHLSAAQFEQLCELLCSYHDVFASDDDVIGCIPVEKGVFHRIPTPGDLQPVRQRGYGLSMHERLFLKSEVQRLLRLGVIRPSSSPWMSLVVMVKKPNGKLRLTIDYRLVNKHTIADPYPLPTVEDMHASMAGCTMWSQLDAVTGFWQAPVAEEDVPKTGFTNPFGNFEWTRRPMGMVSSPSTFQRLMDDMLNGVENARTYVDDTFCFTSGFDAQLRVLDQVLTRVREYGLLLQPSKCSFCVERVVCLGPVVDKDGVRPVDDKVAAIVQLPLPRTVRAVKGFLGMMGCYRKFIKDFAKLAAPLETLTRRSVSFQ